MTRDITEPVNVHALQTVNEEGEDVARYICALRVWRDPDRPLNDLYVQRHRAPGRRNLAPLAALTSRAVGAVAAEQEAMGWLGYVRYADGRDPVVDTDLRGASPAQLAHRQRMRQAWGGKA